MSKTKTPTRTMLGVEPWLSPAQTLIHRHGIVIIKWRVGSNGCCFPKTGEVEIPQATDVDRFAVIAHEVGHSATFRSSDPAWLREIKAERFSLERLVEFDFDTSEFVKRAREWLRRFASKSLVRSNNPEALAVKIAAEMTWLEGFEPFLADALDHGKHGAVWCHDCEWFWRRWAAPERCTKCGGPLDFGHKMNGELIVVTP